MCSGISILMQFAPQSASWRTQVGPARTRVRSSTMKRDRACEARGKAIDGKSGREGGNRGKGRREPGFCLIGQIYPKFNSLSRGGRPATRQAWLNFDDGL